MKRENRVRKHSDFDRIIRAGAAIKGRCFSIFYEGSDVMQTHIGIAVGKKNGGAVTRVRLKRQVRAMVASLWKDWTIPSNLIIVIRTSYNETMFDDGMKELEESFGKVLANIGKKEK
ncbi:MAG: ribonuclease P protein component [Bacillota bacterium]|nr:ribonuclease P protein component [Bacillota bacterium]